MPIFKRFLNEGHLGVYALHRSKVIAHGWLIFNDKSSRILNGYIKIEYKEALIHYCKVMADFRGQNIYPTIIVALCRKAFNQFNVKRIIIDSEASNIASIKGIKKVGFQSIGKRLYFQCLGHFLFKIVINGN